MGTARRICIDGKSLWKSGKETKQRQREKRKKNEKGALDGEDSQTWNW